MATKSKSKLPKSGSSVYGLQIEYEVGEKFYHLTMTIHRMWARNSERALTQAIDIDHRWPSQESAQYVDSWRDVHESATRSHTREGMKSAVVLTKRGYGTTVISWQADAVDDEGRWINPDKIRWYAGQFGRCVGFGQAIALDTAKVIHKLTGFLTRHAFEEGYSGTLEPRNVIEALKPVYMETLDLDGDDPAGLRAYQPFSSEYLQDIVDNGFVPFDACTRWNTQAKADHEARAENCC